jgi:hypothetical protein
MKERRAEGSRRKVESEYSRITEKLRDIGHIQGPHEYHVVFQNSELWRTNLLPSNIASRTTT